MTTPTLREAAQMAREALQWSCGGEPIATMEIAALEALDAALAQHEDEQSSNPVSSNPVSSNPVISSEPGGFVDSRLNPIRREWQGLTDEQKLSLCKQFPDHLTFNAIEAIEAALREKNS